MDVKSHPPKQRPIGNQKLLGGESQFSLKNNCYQQADNTLVKGHAFMNVWAAQVVCHRRQNKRVYRVREGGREGHGCGKSGGEDQYGIIREQIKRM